MNEGKKMKKVGGEVPQDEQGTDSKVGECPVSQEIIPTQEAPPEEFTSIHPTDQEMEMAELLEGPDPTFFEDHDRDKPTREVQVTGDSLCNEAKERGEKMGEIDQTNLTEGFGEQLITYVKNQLLLQKEENPNHNLGLDDVRRALEQARARGCPSLSAAADEALQGASLNRAGYSPNVGHLTHLQWHNEVGRGTLSWAVPLRILEEGPSVTRKRRCRTRSSAVSPAPLLCRIPL